MANPIQKMERSFSSTSRLIESVNYGNYQLQDILLGRRRHIRFLASNGMSSNRVNIYDKLDKTEKATTDLLKMFLMSQGLGSNPKGVTDGAFKKVRDLREKNDRKFHARNTLQVVSAITTTNKLIGEGNAHLKDIKNLLRGRKGNDVGGMSFTGSEDFDTPSRSGIWLRRRLQQKIDEMSAEVMRDVILSDESISFNILAQGRANQLKRFLYKSRTRERAETGHQYRSNISWSEKDSVALQTVIPSWLSKIYQVLSGDKRNLTYDYRFGMFRSASDVLESERIFREDRIRYAMQDVQTARQSSFFGRGRRVREAQDNLEKVQGRMARLQDSPAMDTLLSLIQGGEVRTGRMDRFHDISKLNNILLPALMSPGQIEKWVESLEMGEIGKKVDFNPLTWWRLPFAIGQGIRSGLRFQDKNRTLTEEGLNLSRVTGKGRIEGWWGRVLSPFLRNTAMIDQLEANSPELKEILTRITSGGVGEIGSLRKRFQRDLDNNIVEVDERRPGRFGQVIKTTERGIVSSASLLGTGLESGSRILRVGSQPLSSGLSGAKDGWSGSTGNVLEKSIMALVHGIGGIIDGSMSVLDTATGHTPVISSLKNSVKKLGKTDINFLSRNRFTRAGKIDQKIKEQKTTISRIMSGIEKTKEKIFEKEPPKDVLTIDNVFSKTDLKPTRNFVYAGVKQALNESGLNKSRRAEKLLEAKRIKEKNEEKKEKIRLLRQQEKSLQEEKRKLNIAEASQRRSTTASRIKSLMKIQRAGKGDLLNRGVASAGTRGGSMLAGLMGRMGLSGLGGIMGGGFKALMTSGGMLARLLPLLITNPIGLSIVAIAGVGYAVYKFWPEIMEGVEKLKKMSGEFIDEVKDFASGKWEKIKQTFSNIGEYIVTPILDSVKSFGIKIKNFFGDIWFGIKDMFLSSPIGQTFFGNNATKAHFSEKDARFFKLANIAIQNPNDSESKEALAKIKDLNYFPEGSIKSIKDIEERRKKFQSGNKGNSTSGKVLADVQIIPGAGVTSSEVRDYVSKSSQISAPASEYVPLDPKTLKAMDNANLESLTQISNEQLAILNQNILLLAQSLSNQNQKNIHPIAPRQASAFSSSPQTLAEASGR